MRKRFVFALFVLVVPFFLWNCETRRTFRNVPKAPSGLSGATGSPEVTLHWTDNSKNETHFTIERKIGEGKWEIIAQVDTNATTYTDLGVPAGEIRYRITADNKNGRSTRSNEIAVTVAEENPVFSDLAVQSIGDLVVTCFPELDGVEASAAARQVRLPPLTLCSTSVAFTIENKGLASAANFLVRVAFGDEGGDQPFTEIGVAELEAGTALPLWAEVPGSFSKACVTVNSSRSVEESDGPEGPNNTLCLALPDLAVQSIDLVNARPPQEMGGGRYWVQFENSVTFTLVNAGSEAVVDPFNVHVDFGATGLFADLEVNEELPLEAGKTLQLTVVSPLDGVCFDPDCFVCITLDTGLAVRESNEENNRRCEAVAPADLIVEAIEGPSVKCPPQVGDLQQPCTTSGKVTVKNIGWGRAGPFTVFIELSNNFEDTLSFPVEVDGLDPGSTKEIAIDGKAGEFSMICATADYHQEVWESDESNNDLCKALPDLAVIAGSFSLHQTQLIAVTSGGGGVPFSYRLDFTIENRGREDVVDGFIVSLDAGSGQHLGEVAVSAPLDAGDRMDLSLEGIPAESLGCFSPSGCMLCATADSGEKIPESNEGNNRTCEPISLKF